MVASSDTASAQFQACTGTTPLQTAATWSATLFDDAVVNCDMLQHDAQNNTIKAIVYGRRNIAPTAGTGSADANLYVTDWAGNSATMNIPGGSAPDVVLCNGDGLPGSAPYRAVVTYKIAGNAFVSIFDINNPGSPTIGITPVLVHPISTPGHSLGESHNEPHIDAWTDPAWINSSSGLPMVHEFAIVWGEDPTPGTPPNIFPYDLYTTIGDAHNLAPLTWFMGTTLIGGDMAQPDVACVTEVASGGLIGHQWMEITYYQPSSNPATKLFHAQLNKTTGFPLPTFVTAPILSGGSATMIDQCTLSPEAGMFSPRIEAMNQYDPTASPAVARWQIVATKGSYPSTGAPTSPGNVYRAFGYNDLTGFGGTLLSGAYTNHDVKGTCVAAGVGPAFATGPMGNAQYTCGFFAESNVTTSNSVVTRMTDPATGALDSRWWEVSCNVTNYPWDASRSLALSNCSNSGLNLLAAWYDGTNVVFKETINTMAFRQAPTGVGQTSLDGFKVFPNPTGGMLQIEGASKGAEYSINDITGRILLGGSITSGRAQVDIRSLPNGVYLLRLTDAFGLGKTIRFSKQ